MKEKCKLATVVVKLLPRKHFPGHRGMAMLDRFGVKFKNQTNFELLSTGKILFPKIFQIFDL